MTTKEDWQQAWEHFKAVEEQYKELVGVHWVDTGPAISMFAQLTKMYLEGDRSPELLEQLQTVE